MATIVIYTAGTLGDHLPFIALSHALTQKGHRVRLAINQAVHPCAKRFGLETIALTDVERCLGRARENGSVRNFWNTENQCDQIQADSFDMTQYISQAEELIQLCRSADLLISTSIRTLGFVVHNALELPWITVSLNPYPFRQPQTAEEQNVTFQVLQKEYESLKPLLSYAFKKLNINKNIPLQSEGWLFADHILLASSSHFSQPDLDQLQPHSSIDLTGFWFYEDPSWKNWKPDKTLLNFCERSSMVLSFSSQPLEDPRQTLKIHVQAAAKIGLPLLIQRGQAGFSEADLPSNIDPENYLFADYLPHDWLFAHAACVIQHGGIGTIARSLRQGCPILVEPHGNEQIYNGSLVSENLKVGTVMHPFKMTVDGLAHVLEDKVLRPKYRSRAQAFGEKIAAETGLRTSCRLIEAYLNQQQNPGQTAFSYTPYRFRLNALANPKTLQPEESDHPLSAIPEILHQTWKDTLIPQALVKFQRSCKNHHPNWGYLLWTDDDNREFLKQHYSWFLPVYDGYPEHIMRVDTIRYFLLYHFGGVYVDLDFESIKPLDPLLKEKELILGTEPDDRLHLHHPIIQPFTKMLSNGFMASRARHPFWEHVFKQLIVYCRAPDPLDATGPSFLTRAYDTFQLKESISIISDNLLYPITSSQNHAKTFLGPVEHLEILKNSYGIHHWFCTWRKESQATRAGQVKVSVLLRGETTEMTSLLSLEEFRLQLQQLHLPLVSCLLLAGDQIELVQRSIHCFQRQTYPQKELIIIDNSSGDKVAQWVEQQRDKRITSVRVPTGEISLEELLPMAAEQAAGEYIAYWKVQDLLDPRRLEIQIAAIKVLKADCCFLERQQLWWPEKEQLAFSACRIWENSLVCERAMLDHHSGGEQNEATIHLADIISNRRIAVIDFPQLYTTMLHKDTPVSPDIWRNLWLEVSAVFNNEIYQIFTHHIQNRLELDLPAWIGQQPTVTDKVDLQPLATDQKSKERSVSIPMILHQTWKDGDIPFEFKSFQRSWQTHHPDWQYCLWTDIDLRQFLHRYYPWFLPIYDQYPENIKRVDAVRYFVLSHYGGVFIDLDFECLQPINSLLAGQQVVFGLEPPEHLELHFPKERGLKQIVCNAFMASIPGHPFWEHVFKQLVQYHRARGPLDATGSFLLTRACESYEQRNSLTILPFDLIYPVSSEKPWPVFSPEAQAQIIQKAYAIHHWRGTWWRETLTKKEQVKVSVLVKGLPVTVSAIQVEQIQSLFTQQSILPKISCTMVTKNRPSFAKRAIRCFQQQTYKNKELLIVDDGEDDTLEEWAARLNDDHIVYVRLPAENKKLGELRNIAVRRSSGTYVTQWDDDDLSDPERLQIQLATIHALQTDACFLERQQIWWLKKRRFTTSCRRLWEGSFVCIKDKLPFCSAQPQGEDIPVIEHIVRNGRVALLDLPRLYTYIFHGANTYDSARWKAHWLAATESHDGDAYDIKLRELKSRLQFDFVSQPNYSQIKPTASAAPKKVGRVCRATTKPSNKCQTRHTS